MRELSYLRKYLRNFIAGARYSRNGENSRTISVVFPSAEYNNGLWKRSCKAERIIMNFQTYLDTEITPVYIIAEEEILCRGGWSAHLEQLHQVIELSVNVAADWNRKKNIPFRRFFIANNHRQSAGTFNINRDWFRDPPFAPSIQRTAKIEGTLIKTIPTSFLRGSNHPFCVHSSYEAINRAKVKISDNLINFSLE